jgi:hypothetical protein
MRVDVFRKVVEHYGGNNLPERRFVDNTLQTNYGLHPAVLDEFVDLFEKNCRTAKIGKDLPSKGPTSSNGQGEGAVVSTRITQTKGKNGDRPVTSSVHYYPTFGDGEHTSSRICGLTCVDTTSCSHLTCADTSWSRLGSNQRPSACEMGF